MDVAGLATSLFGVDGLFKAALEAWEFVDAGRAGAGNFSCFRAELDNQRTVFLIWAERLGFFSDEGYNKELNSPQSRARKICATLNQIYRLFSTTDRLAQKHGLQIHGIESVAGDNSASNYPAMSSAAILHSRYTALRAAIGRWHEIGIRAALTEAVTRRRQKRASVWKKSRWSICDDKKSSALLGIVADLVNNLDVLTRDVNVTRTSECLAADVAGGISEATLADIEETPRSATTVISSAASTRLKAAETCTTATWTSDTETYINNRAYQPLGTENATPQHLDEGTPSADSQNPAHADDGGRFSFQDLETESRRACAKLSASVPARRVYPRNHRISPQERTVNRVLREMRDWGSEGPNGWFTISPISECSLDTFLGTIRGPARTPYEEGIFHICLALGENYPFSPPRVWFLTKVLHPNVDARGAICIDILDSSKELCEQGLGWSPIITLGKILVCIASLLDEPNWDNPITGSLPPEWTSDRELFQKRAKEWTRRYATGRIIFPGEGDDEFCTVTAWAVPKEQRGVEG